MVFRSVKSAKGFTISADTADVMKFEEVVAGICRQVDNALGKTSAVCLAVSKKLTQRYAAWHEIADY